jgi:hypothetical protein
MDAVAGFENRSPTGLYEQRAPVRLWRLCVRRVACGM